MVYSTKHGTGVLGTMEEPLEAVAFEATIEHAQNAILSFIAKARPVSGKDLADYKGQNLMARVAPTSKSRRGDKIVVAMDTHKIHLFDPESEKTLLN